MTEFDDAVADINGGVFEQWYKLDEASGDLTDEGSSSRDLSFRGTTGFTYQITGSEVGVGGSKGISIGGDKTPFQTGNGMGSATDFSMFIVYKAQNGGAAGDLQQTFMSIVPINVSTRELRFAGNRNSDSNGAIFCGIFSGAAPNGTQTVVLKANLPADFDDGNYHTLGVVQRNDGNGLIIYMDGTLPTQTPTAFGSGSLDSNFSTLGYANSDDFSIGVLANSAANHRIEGHLDNAIMWRYALTQAEMFTLMTVTAGSVLSTTRRTGRRVFTLTEVISE